MKKMMDIVNYISYKHAKSQYETLFIIDYTKMTKFGDLKMCTVHYTQIHIFDIFV
jgi:hypothetical protein